MRVMTMSKVERFSCLSVVAMLAMLGSAPGCDEGEPASDDSQGADDGTEGGSNENGSNETDPSSPRTDEGGSDETTSDSSGDAEPVFAIPTEVFGPDFSTSTSYVPLTPSLDVARVELDNAREYPERASAATVGDYLFVAASTEPVIHRFSVAVDGMLVEEGSISFMNYGVPESFSIDPWGGYFINPEKAYIFNGTFGSHIVWNPTTFEIGGELPGPENILQEGYDLESVAVVRGNRMYRIFTLLNYDTWEFLVEPQYLAVYDLDNDEMLDMVQDSRCPQLYSRPFIDEQGDIYFSGWVWTPGLTLTAGYPASCALRIRNGEDTFDPEWQLNFAADLTDGREGAIMRYLGNGQALLDVFHAEMTTFDEATDPLELVQNPIWRLWTVDLQAMTGAPVDGLDFKAGGYQDVVIDDRTFIMVPNENYSETTAFEVVDGQALEKFKIQGNSYHMVKVR